MRAAKYWILLLAMAHSVAFAGDKFTVRVVEASSVLNTGNGLVSGNVFAKVILPNGDHASLMCGNKRCALPKPWAPEKMSPNATDCATIGTQSTCTTHDLGDYSATRKGNWLTIEAPNGKLTFEITGSW
jgi:hypothetical protein